jgi:hypothetical protein
MTQDQFHTLVGLLLAFSFPIVCIFTVVMLFLIPWLLFTMGSMLKPVWIVLYVLFRAVLYFSLWFFVLAGICWLCGWSDPIHYMRDFYCAAPGAIYRWFTK